MGEEFVSVLFTADELEMIREYREVSEATSNKNAIVNYPPPKGGGLEKALSQ